LKKVLIFFFIFLLSIGFVSGDKVVTEIGMFDEGFDIKFPPFNTFEQGQDVELSFHVFNQTNGNPMVEGISCDFHLYNNSGTHLSEQTDLTVSHNYDYEFKIKGGNFTKLGDYGYLVSCNNSVSGGFVGHSLQITKSGTDEETIYFFLLLIFIPLIIGLFALFSSFFLGEEHEVLKIVLMLFSFICTFGTFWFAQIVIGSQYAELKDLTEGLGFFIWFYGLTIAVLIMYFLIYAFAKMIHRSAQKDAKDEIKY